MTNNNDGFIVKLVSHIIDILQFYTINGYVRKKSYPTNDGGRKLDIKKNLTLDYYNVSDTLHLVLCAIPFIGLPFIGLFSLSKTSLLATIISIYIVWRIVSVFINQTAVLLNTDSLNNVNKNCTPNAKRLLILALLQFFELIALFAILYLIYSYHFVINSQTSCIDLSTTMQALYFSVVTVLTLGYGDITPKDNWGAFIVLMQCFFGTGMLLVIIARFVSYINIK